MKGQLFLVAKPKGTHFHLARSASTLRKCLPVSGHEARRFSLSPWCPPPSPLSQDPLVAQFKRCSRSTLPAPRAQSQAPGGEVTGAPASHQQQRPRRSTGRRPTRAEEDPGGKGLRPKTGGVCLPRRASRNFRPRATSGPKSVSPAGAAASRR